MSIGDYLGVTFLLTLLAGLTGLWFGYWRGHHDGCRYSERIHRLEKEIAQWSRKS